MTSKRTTLQTKIAAAELKIARKVDGETATYSHQGGTGITIWVRPDIRQPEQVSAPDASGVVIETETRYFGCPKQTSSEGTAFSAAYVSENDELTWNSVVYVVKDWSLDAYSGQVVIRAVRAVPRRTKP